MIALALNASTANLISTMPMFTPQFPYILPMDCALSQHDASNFGFSMYGVPVFLLVGIMLTVVFVPSLLNIFCKMSFFSRKTRQNLCRSVQNCDLDVHPTSNFWVRLESKPLDDRQLSAYNVGEHEHFPCTSVGRCETDTQCSVDEQSTSDVKVCNTRSFINFAGHAKITTLACLCFLPVTHGAVIEVTAGGTISEPTYQFSDSSGNNVAMIKADVSDGSLTAGNPSGGRVQMKAQDFVTTSGNSIDGLASSKIDTTSVDSVPTDGSSNPVSSNGVYDALASARGLASGVISRDNVICTSGAYCTVTCPSGKVATGGGGTCCCYGENSCSNDEKSIMYSYPSSTTSWTVRCAVNPTTIKQACAYVLCI